MVASSSWFVKVDGKIRGPFNLEQLKSMKDRGRVIADTEVSQDRTSWVFAVSIPELFGEIISVAPGGVGTGAGVAQMHGMVPAQPPAPYDPSGSSMVPTAMPAAMGAPGEMMPHPGVGYPQMPAAAAAPEPDPECYYQVDGIRQGPVRLSGVRDLITVGTLKPNDFVWLEGSPTWIQVQDVPQLAIPDQITRATKQFRASPVLISCVAMIAMFLIALPTWYILSADSYKEQVRKEAAAMVEAERQEQLRLELIARDESHRMQNMTVDERRHRESMALLDRDNDQFDENVQLKESEITAQKAGFNKMANALGYFKDETNKGIGEAKSAAATAQNSANNAQSTANNAQSSANNAQNTASNAQNSANSAQNSASNANSQANKNENDIDQLQGKK